MSELDDLFGPKPKVEMPEAKPSYFAEYPAFQEVCEVFMEEMGWEHDPWTVKVVIAGGRDFYDAHGNDSRLVRRTIKWIRINEPHIYDKIASPRSLITHARSLGRKPDPDSEAGRQKYLKGVDDG